MKKLAGFGTLIGALTGAARKKDPGEGRAGAIARSAGTGLATDVGSSIGAAPGIALAKWPMGNNRAKLVGLLAAAVGGGLGGGLAFNTFKRKKTAAIKEVLQGALKTAQQHDAIEKFRAYLEKRAGLDAGTVSRKDLEPYVSQKYLQAASAKNKPALPAPKPSTAAAPVNPLASQLPPALNKRGQIPPAGR